MTSRVVSDLGVKLKYLFKVHPTIHNQRQLAKALNYSDARISRWTNGTDPVSYKNLQSLCDLFFMPEEYFFEENIRVAERMLHLTNQATLWQQLVNIKTDSDALCIHDLDEMNKNKSRPVKRSLEHDDDLDHIPRDGRIRVHLIGQPNWFVLLFMRDAEDTYCLTPTIEDPNHRIAKHQDQFILPTDNDYLELQSPRGLGSVIAVIRSTDWSASLLNALQTDDQDVFYRGLNHLTKDLQKSEPDTWQVLEKSFRLV